MPLFTTPRQLVHKADLFYQLSQLTTAGIGLIPALELQHRSPPAASLRAPISRILERLNTGSTFAEALHHAPRWIPAFDQALLQAGESSGRLPVVFLSLAQYYRDRAELIRSFLGAIAYPVFVLHMAAFIFPIGALQGLILQGEVGAYLIQKVALLLPLYLAVLVVLVLTQESRGPWIRAGLERLCQLVPVLGSALRHLALARLASTLEALLNAGAPVMSSWELAGAASGSPALDLEIRGFKPHLESGDTPAELVRRSRKFPSIFANQYASGEVSGKLDESLRWLYRHHQEEGARKLRTAVKAAGGILFGLVVLVVAWQVLSFYIGYFQQIQQVIP